MRLKGVLSPRDAQFPRGKKEQLKNVFWMDCDIGGVAEPPRDPWDTYERRAVCFVLLRIRTSQGTNQALAELWFERSDVINIFGWRNVKPEEDRYFRESGQTRAKLPTFSLLERKALYRHAQEDLMSGGERRLPKQGEDGYGRAMKHVLRSAEGSQRLNGGQTNRILQSATRAEAELHQEELEERTASNLRPEYEEPRSPEEQPTYV